MPLEESLLQEFSTGRTQRPIPSNKLYLGTVVFDFDGTISLGDGPVLAYAHHAFAHLDEPRRAEAEHMLYRYLHALANPANPVNPSDSEDSANSEGPKNSEGPTSPTDSKSPENSKISKGPEDSAQGEIAGAVDWNDGYDAVVSLCGESVGPELRNEAYLASREDLASGSVSVHAPHGLHEFLETLGELGCRRVLLSNSPTTGLVQTLQRFGVDGLFDEVIASAGKPSHWNEHLAYLTATARSTHLLSIGDYWSNDVEPVVAQGFQGALIGERTPESSVSGPHPTYQAATLPELYQPIIDGCSAWRGEDA